jgi:glycosyltransferase involved in cell wall biosynthesis
MRVALISHNARAGDAIGNQVAARAAFFRDHGAEVTVLIESDNHLHPELSPLARLVSSRSDLAELASELGEFDLLVVEYGQHYGILDVLPRVAGKGPRILFDYHGVTPPHLWDGPAEALREGQRNRALVWYADHAIVHSRFMRRELCDATGYPEERVHLLPLWFNNARLQPTAAGGRLRHKLGLADERIVLFVGRMAANKRVPVLIEAISKLKDSTPPIHAVIIGDHGDRYRREFDRCCDLTIQRQISDRVHFLGHVSEDDLADAYRSADVFVMPSLHEGCCIPALEAMAAGVPVIVARAAALPETTAGAGLTFKPDDSDDLAMQIRRVLAGAFETQREPRATRRIAVISPRYGDGVLGGAERSLRLIAETLAGNGSQIEVFTTGRGDEVVNGVWVHRFPADPVDERALTAAAQAMQRKEAISDEALTTYLQQTRYSAKLLESFAERCGEFDTIIVGPYGNGLTCETMRLNPDRTLVAPCFHREPLASHPKLAELFSRVGGLMYHSDAERRFAEMDLGISHPNSSVIGTWLPEVIGNVGRGRRFVGKDRPYLLYAGRFCREKNLPLLLEWQKTYAAEHPNRFRFAFVGGGTVTLPDGDAWTNLGFLSEADKADVIAGAAAIVQLSVNESLSLVALEAWQAGVPVIGHSACDAIREMIEECRGGFTVESYEQFRVALDEIWLGWGADRGLNCELVQERITGSRAVRDLALKNLANSLDSLPNISDAPSQSPPRPADLREERDGVRGAERQSESAISSSRSDWAVGVTQEKVGERGPQSVTGRPPSPRPSPPAKPQGDGALGVEVVGSVGATGEGPSGAAQQWAPQSVIERSLGAIGDRFHDMGCRGQEFVRERFGSRQVFAKGLTSVMMGLGLPLAELMRERGRTLTEGRTTEKWQEAFAERIESVLHVEPGEFRAGAAVVPRKGESLRVHCDTRRVGIRISNVGTIPLWSDGEHATRLRCRVVQADGEFDREATTKLPRPLNPGESTILAIRVPLMGEAGQYRSCFSLVNDTTEIAAGEVPMQVMNQEPTDVRPADDMNLGELAERLAAAEPLAELPANYIDVSEGLFASLKQSIKQKLLHQFQTSYVDVLSRQQTAFNQAMLAAIQELTECAAMLGSAPASPADDLSTELLRTTKRLKEQVRRMASRIDSLEKRLDSLETRAPSADPHEPLPAEQREGIADS